MIVLILILVNIVFYAISPEKIVDLIGIENVYAAIFLIATFGGLNTFSSPILYSAVAGFAAEGASPWLLGLFGGVGVAIGDLLVFSLFRLGLTGISGAVQGRAERAQRWLDKVPRSLQLIFLYLVLGFTPIPNDIVMAGLVVLRYNLRVVAPMIIVADITFVMIVAHTGDTLLSSVL